MHPHRVVVSALLAVHIPSFVVGDTLKSGTTHIIHCEDNGDCSEQGEQISSEPCYLQGINTCSEKGHKKGFSAGAIEAISICAAAVALILLALAFWIYFLKRRLNKMRTQRILYSHRAIKERSIAPLPQIFQHSYPPYSQQAAPPRNSFASVPSLQALSQHEPSIHSVAGLPQGGPPPIHTLPYTSEHESQSVVSSWVNKLNQTKIMSWLHLQHQDPEPGPNPLTHDSAPSRHSTHSIHGAPTALQRPSVGHSSLARSSLNHHPTPLHTHQARQILCNGSSPCMHDMSSHDHPISPYSQPPTGGSLSGTSMATSAHAQPLPPIYGLQLSHQPSASKSLTCMPLPPELIPPVFGQAPTGGDSTTSAAIVLPQASPTVSGPQPTAAFSAFAQAHSLPEESEYFGGGGKISTTTLPLPQTPKALSGMHVHTQPTLTSGSILGQPRAPLHMHVRGASEDTDAADMHAFHQNLDPRIRYPRF